MRAWILGVALVGATGGGVAIVLAGKDHQSPGGPSAEAKPTETCPDTGCPACKPTPPSDAADVTDLSALFATADISRPRVSFEEPPFAPPVKSVAVELAPSPRPVGAEECPMPRPVTISEEAPMPRTAG